MWFALMLLGISVRAGEGEDKAGVICLYVFM